jgi:hypothetical protein
MVNASIDFAPMEAQSIAARGTCHLRSDGRLTTHSTTHSVAGLRGREIETAVSRDQIQLGAGSGSAAILERECAGAHHWPPYPWQLNSNLTTT